jgi:transposase-like protein
LERIVSAARDVQAASSALERHFESAGDGQPSTLELDSFEAAMQELKEAREAFEVLLNRWAR